MKNILKKLIFLSLGLRILTGCIPTNNIVNYSDGDWNFSGGIGAMSYSDYNGFGANTNELRYSALVNYDDGKTGLSL